MLTGMDYLIQISFVPDDEIFKICLDYWNYLVPQIYADVKIEKAQANAAWAPFGTQLSQPTRRQLYAGILSKLRLLMITRMAKPEEVSFF